MHSAQPQRYARDNDRRAWLCKVFYEDHQLSPLLEAEREPGVDSIPRGGAGLGRFPVRHNDELALWQEGMSAVDARYAGAWELPVLGAVAAPTEVSMARPVGRARPLVTPYVTSSWPGFGPNKPKTGTTSSVIPVRCRAPYGVSEVSVARGRYPAWATGISVPIEVLVA